MARQYYFVPSCWFILVASLTLSAANASDQDITFARDVQPILAKHCLLCHGPDDDQGGLQLHQRDLALSESDSGESPIVPGDSIHSELLSRITSSDPDVRMPPEGDPLSSEEVSILRKWIDDGVKWEVHWAYRPLNPTPVPTPRNTDVVENDIDRFIVAKLESENLEPSPPADRYSLLKRLHYDLTGLPPSPQDTDDFAGGRSKGDYEDLVDRLLASPHFGERWGRHWLDKARYADSDGYEKDNHRPDAWRYRDWVINAINEDMPFDQFTIEQLAGDMLPDAQPLQKLATAFHRQTLTNSEGGTDSEQWRVAAVMDRTETLGTVWLGLSVGCARCHSHKYDQITQREYYQLYAYFNNGDETNASVPISNKTDEAIIKKRGALAKAISERRRVLETSIDEWLPDLRDLAQSDLDHEPQFHLLDDVSIEGPKGVTFKQSDDESWLVKGKRVEQGKYTIRATCEAEEITGIRLEVLPDDSLPGKGPGLSSNGNFVLNEISLHAAPDPKWSEANKQAWASATASYSQKNWPVGDAIDGKTGTGQKGTGWAIAPKHGKTHSAVFYLEKPVPEGSRNLRIELNHTYGTRHNIGRFRLSAVTGKPPSGLPKDVIKIALADQRSEVEQERLLEWKTSEDERFIDLQERLSALADKTINARVINQRTQQPRTTHVLRRGEFKQPLEEVSAGTFSTLPPIKPRGDRGATDRLDLARWLVSGENPLVPRVAANHIWKNLFGEGIVPTMNDFGVRGDAPSHPKLLDHLAQKLIEFGWSRKKLIKYITMSGTYRQSSRHRTELLEIDPTNRLLHRQNRFRVEAEIIRDLSLGASGLLSKKVGGPSVFPPIPPGVTDLTYNSKFKWNTSTGDDRYRRGMYTYFKRTAPHPNLITFDCPDSNVTNVDRDRSNTPIGALVTLNNESFVEAARAMAQHVLQQDELNNDRSKIVYALSRCIVRIPASEEIDNFETLLRISDDWYSDHAADAKELVGDRPAANTSVETNAAWIATIRMMLNLDEFITRE